MRYLIPLLLLLGFTACATTATTTPKIPAGWVCDDKGCFEQTTVTVIPSTQKALDLPEVENANACYPHPYGFVMTHDGTKYLFVDVPRKVSYRSAKDFMIMIPGYERGDGGFWELVGPQDSAVVAALCERSQDSSIVGGHPLKDNFGCQCAWTDVEIDNPEILGHVKTVIAPNGRLSARVTDAVCGVILRRVTE